MHLCHPKKDTRNVTAQVAIGNSAAKKNLLFLAGYSFRRTQETQFRQSKALPKLATSSDFSAYYDKRILFCQVYIFKDVIRTKQLQLPAAQLRIAQSRPASLIEGQNNLIIFKHDLLGLNHDFKSFLHLINRR